MTLGFKWEVNFRVCDRPLHSELTPPRTLPYWKLFHYSKLGFQNTLSYLLSFFMKIPEKCDHPMSFFSQITFNIFTSHRSIKNLLSSDHLLPRLTFTFARYQL